ncbi:Cmk4 [Desulforapulum autotrophicum HRM2]|uniref:Cmk4 n=1 Tax=Desulforapulum autotrophicum (strain ATCC 43914 / DSM 3382 / VKM B-1955 / HRM2) TaxID=177437 RepID=C0QJH4_DESAH|nr:cytidylate kinase-like family protein [Desulforapulum autotrophicum]ACN13827.1 Cmk4 [Desulforapulum autotrophicum HRM2]
MSIITISRGSYSMGKTVAEKVAQRLNFDIISRDVLLDASNHFNVPEIKLINAIHDAPKILDRYSRSKNAYIAYIRSSLVERALNDNLVYHGLAGHLLLKGIPHVLKVRITENLEGRIANMVKRDKISPQEARSLILADDSQRRKWTRSLYGEDTRDTALYDLSICIDKLSIDNAVDFICQAAGTKGLQTTEQGRQEIADLAVACRVKAALVDEFPNLGVACEYGNVLIYMKGRDSASGKLVKKLNNIRNNIKGINHLETHAGVEFPLDAI